MKRRELKKSNVMTAVLFALLIFTVGVSYADIRLKVAVVNPSSTTKQTTPIKYDLPKGIGPDHIIDIGTLEMKYDFDKGNYYLFGSVTLDPSEKKVIEVTLKDVWTIPEKELNDLKSHTNVLMKRLNGTKHFTAGNSLSTRIYEQLDGIIAKGKEPDISVKERINRYYEDIVILNEVKDNIGMLENLVLDTGGIVEERVQIPVTLAVPLKTAELQGAKEIIELKIRITNPSQKAKQVTPVRYSLPAEISPRYVIDRDSLDMAYDFNKECFYLHKDDLELEPEETKEYVIKVKDIWKIDDVEIGALKKHTGNIMLLLKDTEFFAQGKIIADDIDARLSEIVRTQSLKVSAVEHIAYYRDNTKSLQRVKERIAELERLVSQRGTSAGITVKWPDEIKGGGREMKMVGGYEGVDRMAQSIFRGKAPPTATLWKVIFGIIGFVGVISALFFALWYIQSERSSKK